MSLGVAAACVLLGAAGLAGWLLNVPGLTRPLPVGTAMAPGTAAALACLGGALLAAGNRRRVSGGLALLGGAIGAAAVTQYALEWRAGALWAAPSTVYTTRVAPNTAVALVLAGLAISLLARRASGDRRLAAAGALAGLVMAVASTALLGYATGLQPAYGWAQLTQMAVPTATGLLLLGGGVIARAWCHSRGQPWIAPWIAWAVAGFAATFVCVLWQALVHENRAHVRVATGSEARAASHALQGAVQERQALAARWARRVARVGGAAWDAEADLLLDSVEGLDGIGWRETDGRLHWRGAGPPLPAALAKAVENGGLTSGFTAGSFIVAAPVPVVGRFQGTVFGAFDGAVLFATELYVAPESCLTVLAQGQPVFARHCAVSTEAHHFASEAEVAAPGLGWSVRVLPGPALVRHSQAPLVHAGLGVGLALAVLMFVAIRLAQRAATRAAEAEDSSRGLAVEVAERQRAEADARAQQRLLQSILDVLPVGVWLADKAGEIVYGNAAGQRVWAGARYVGLEKYGEYKGWWADSGRALAPGDWGMARAIRGGETSLDEVIDIACFDGTRKTIVQSAVPLVDSDGALNGAFVVMQDVTERRAAERALRESELLYRTIVDTAQEGVWQVDPQGRTTFVNRRMADMLGCGPEDVVGRPMYDFIADSRQEEVRHRFEERAPQAAFDIPLLRHDGSQVWTMVSASPLFLPGHGFSGAIALIADITERKRAEQTLAAYAGQLELSNKDLQEFAVAASHDLQEPLRKITAFGGYLAERAAPLLDAESRDYLERMQSAARRMAGLIDSLLDLARVSTRAQPFQATDLDRVLRDVLADLEVRVRETGARVSAGALPIVRADPVQMRQVLQNLVGNALKFHRPGRPPAVDVRAHTGEDGGLHIEIADEGIGFEERHLDLIFRPFQRLHSRADFEGNGMGLAICRKIALRHGGSLGARSTPGQGSVFTLILPAALREERQPCPIASR